MKVKTHFQPPKVVRVADPKPLGEFPVDSYSYSAMHKFSTNPVLFKVKYINKQKIDTLSGVSSVIGNAFHVAMQAYYSTPNENDAIQIGLETGLRFVDEYHEGFIDFGKTVKDKPSIAKIFTFAYNSYVTESKHDKWQLVDCEIDVEPTAVEVEWNGQMVRFPVPITGKIDKVVRSKEDGLLRVIDYKCCAAFSDEEKIDGKKILQAIQYYFLCYAKYGEAPHSMIFEEVKRSKNKDGGKQVRKYEMVYGQLDQFFSFYLRFYDDMTRALNGEMVYVPNVDTFFDNEVSVVAYIHRLDVPEEQATQMKAERVKNITELLHSKMVSASNMKKLLATAEKELVTAKSLNLENMEPQDRIKAKLMEHGLLVDFDSKVIGHSVTLYRFAPTLGVKMASLRNLSDDVQQALGAESVRVLAPIVGTTLVGFEVPNSTRSFPEAMPEPRGFEIAMGVDVNGHTHYFDIRKAPHMLVAGATGSGKSVFLNSVITQLAKVPNSKLHLYDPKMVELRQFQGVATEYETDNAKIVESLGKLVNEMNVRYDAMASAGARNIEQYGKLPYIFAVIDEFGDLSATNKDANGMVLLLAQKARAAGIHLIVATQRPSVDVITGTIKANFPTKVAFRMAKATDSQVLLDSAGAEKLQGKGDMLFVSDEGEKRLQGFYA